MDGAHVKVENNSFLLENSYDKINVKKKSFELTGIHVEYRWFHGREKEACLGNLHLQCCIPCTHFTVKVSDTWSCKGQLSLK